MEISKCVDMEDEELWVDLTTFPNWGHIDNNPCREIPMNDYVGSVDVANDSDVSAINIWRRHLTGTSNIAEYIERTSRENMESMIRSMSLDFTSLYPSLMSNYSIFHDFTYTPFDDYIFRHRFTDDWLYYPCPT